MVINKRLLRALPQSAEYGALWRQGCEAALLPPFMSVASPARVSNSLLTTRSFQALNCCALSPPSESPRRGTSLYSSHLTALLGASTVPSPTRVVTRRMLTRSSWNLVQADGALTSTFTDQSKPSLTRLASPPEADVYSRIMHSTNSASCSGLLPSMSRAASTAPRPASSTNISRILSRSSCSCLRSCAANVSPSRALWPSQ
mmetsp:Transcript_39788/g.110618  ORF Transcript_39788/g.110618 Transcript_39788/m.110618 type:complete len:202 (+) Transcript_39788:142-747(+)